MCRRHPIGRSGVSNERNHLPLTIAGHRPQHPGRAIRELAVRRQQALRPSAREICWTGIGRALTSLGAMRQEDIWDVEAALRYDTPSTGMFAPEVLGRPWTGSPNLLVAAGRWSSPSAPAASPFP